MKPCLKPVHKKKSKRAPKISERKALEMEAERLSRELCAWLWPECAFKDMDGARCRGGLQWSHLIARSKSNYMIYMPGNTVMGCAGHNGLDKWGDQYLSVWYSSKFGAGAWKALWDIQIAHVKKQPELWELQEWIDRYQYLLDDRPAVFTFDHLLELGYFGEWCKNV